MFLFIFYLYRDISIILHFSHIELFNLLQKISLFCITAIVLYLLLQSQLNQSVTIHFTALQISWYKKNDI